MCIQPTDQFHHLLLARFFVFGNVVKMNRDKTKCLAGGKLHVRPQSHPSTISQGKRPLVDDRQLRQDSDRLKIPLYGMLFSLDEQTIRPV